MCAEARASTLFHLARCWVHAHLHSSIAKLLWGQVRAQRTGDEPLPRTFSDLIMIALLVREAHHLIVIIEFFPKHWAYISPTYY